MSELAKRLHEIFVVDYERGILVWKIAPKYHPRMLGRLAGCKQASGHNDKTYCNVRFDGERHKRGRIIFAMANGRWPTPCVDHINGDSLDDRLNNLREATVTQNAWNHKRRKKVSPLPMGVRVSSSRFYARIAFNKKLICLGGFATPEEAHAAYLSKRQELYREFA